VDLLDWAGLAATTTAAALLQAASGFGFAVLATPLFLLFVDPSCAVQLVIIITTVLSLVVLPGLWRAIVPGLLVRLGLGSLAGLPVGLVAFRLADRSWFAHWSEERSSPLPYCSSGAAAVVRLNCLVLSP